MVRIALLGPRGSGKEEFAQKLSEKYGVPMVSIGELLKQEVGSGSSLGADILKGQKSKRPVQDDLVLQVLLERLSQEDATQGFVLEGGPKNGVQGKGVDAFLLRQGHGFSGVVLLRYDYDEFMEAMTGRRSCRECGSQFNIYTNPPIVDHICDSCGGRLHSRVDDREEKISRRLREYEAMESPLADYYEARLEVVEGGFNEDRVYQRVVQAAERLRKVTPKSLTSLKQKEGEAMAKEKKKKVAAKKSAPKKKVAAKKAVTKKTAVKKKAAPKKAAPKKTAPKKKAAPKKAAPKKAAPKKAAPKKD